MYCHDTVGTTKFVLYREVKCIASVIRSVLYEKFNCTSLVRSQFSYCTQLWHPHLLKDMLSIERIQHRTIKHILHNYTSSYKFRLLKLKLLPLMYFFELQDVLFAIKSLKLPTKQFNNTNYISFSSTSTRLGTSNKLVHPPPL